MASTSGELLSLEVIFCVGELSAVMFSSSGGVSSVGAVSGIAADLVTLVVGGTQLARFLFLGSVEPSRAS